MKKIVNILCLLLVICCIVTVFTGCSGYEHKKIAADYAKIHNIDNSNVEFVCYGEFNGSHVIMVNGVYPTALSSEVVDGVIFRHPCVQTFDVYKNGNFYSLQEAFNNGLLTHDNLVALRESYNPSGQGADDVEYRLTVQDPNGYLIEPLIDTYRAGEKVTVKTAVLFDVNLIAYLDGVSLGNPKDIWDGDECHLEFYFVMPAHDAVLSFDLSGGM